MFNYKKDWEPEPEPEPEPDKEEKREAIASPKKAPIGSRLSADWLLPKAWGEWAVDEGLDTEVVRREADRFRDYWIAAAGAKGRKADWPATWRNWVREERAPAAARQASAQVQGGRHAGAANAIYDDQPQGDFIDA